MAKEGEVKPDEVLPVEEPVKTEPTVEGVPPAPEFLTKQELEEKVAYLEGKLDERDKHWQSIAERKAGTRREIEEAKREAAKVRDELRPELDYLSQQILAGLPEEERMRAKLEMLERRYQVDASRKQQPEVDPKVSILQALPYVRGKMRDMRIPPDDPNLDWPFDAATADEGEERMLASIDKILEARKAEQSPPVEEGKKTESKAEKKKPELEEEPPPVETGGIRSPASRGVDQLRDAYGAGEISSKEYTEQMRALGKEP